MQPCSRWTSDLSSSKVSLPEAQGYGNFEEFWKTERSIGASERGSPGLLQLFATRPRGYLSAHGTRLSSVKLPPK